MAATPAWLASAEALLNRNIDSSARAAALARRLQGTSLQVDIEGITRLRACALNGRLALLAGEDSAADATISGSLPALLQLLTGAAAGRPAGSAAKVQGDAEIANLYRELLSLARPDPEEELSRWIGDVPARHIAQFAAQAREFLRRASRTAGENISEYLQEESRDLVNRTELDEFLHGVDEIRETADRIEARLARLETRVKSTA
jgi:ubiquinone biosynthesis accessory factor UbiJ